MTLHHVSRVFSFDSNSVRVVIKDDEPWFIAEDVAALLGYIYPERAVILHCNWPITASLVENRLHFQGLIIPEPDVYRLMISSRNSSVEAESWLVGSVLSSLRAIRPRGGSVFTPPRTVFRVRSRNSELESSL